MALNSLAWLGKVRDGTGWEIAAVALGIADAHARGYPPALRFRLRLYVRVDKKQVGKGPPWGSFNQQPPYGYGDKCRHAASQTFDIPVVATRNVERGTI